MADIPFNIACKELKIAQIVQLNQLFQLLHLVHIQLFRERLSDKVHATTPEGIVGGFEFTGFQRNLREWHERPWTYLRVLKESSKSSFDRYSVRNSVLCISHITFRDCRVHIFNNNRSRNSCIRPRLLWVKSQANEEKCKQRRQQRFAYRASLWRSLFILT